MTGRAAGYCAGYSVPGYMNPRLGYGRGWGRGYGRGWRSFPSPYPYTYPISIQAPPQQYADPTYAYSPTYPTPTAQSPEQELRAVEGYKNRLKAEQAALEREMNEIEKRIGELKANIEQEKQR
jgi:hypothetical protein